MTLNEFGELFQTFKTTAFRLESLDAYSVPEEREEFDRFRNGEPLSISQNREWTTFVDSCVRAGKTIQRVHLLPNQLTPYLRFEIDWGYVYSSAAGEDIRLGTRESIDLPEANQDFWLFDDQFLVLMRYDNIGAFLGIEQLTAPEDIVRFRRTRDYLLKKSEPLRAYLARQRSSAE
jgi:hypothetical protein